VIQAALAGDYVVMITADHGNLEQAITPEGTPHVSHSENPVPFVLIASHARTQPKLHEGKLADVAPTVLAALGLKPTKVMTGKDLVEGKPWEGRQRVLLLILDGWGIGRADESNPIHLASTPIWDGLLARHPHTILQAAGEAVGLKTGKAGNSEAGHINMGAGRVVLQDDVRLDQAMSDGSFTRNGIFTKAMENVVNRNSGLHLIGLLTEKSSHGSIEYPLALLQMAKDHGVENICLHVIFDGRSTEPGSAPRLLEELEHRMDLIDAGRIASGIGRGIALDRDGNYAKTQKAYDMLVFGKGRKVCV
jgi:2,3-bisphosphoglycerate-independent phosphoglycerate mutase